MRGKLFARHNGISGVWITPAGAGKTGFAFACAFLDEDHPRRCGENHRRALRGTENAGSPPQVRGKPAVGIDSIYTRRITPAGAGKTHVFRFSRHPEEDHPRRCGENRGLERIMHWATGSPPQVRGKLNHHVRLAIRRGITPAGAGKTRRYAGFRSSNRDHPRRCGENARELYQEQYALGSPPQVRGKPDH